MFMPLSSSANFSLGDDANNYDATDPSPPDDPASVESVAPPSFGGGPIWMSPGSVYGTVLSWSAFSAPHHAEGSGTTPSPGGSAPTTGSASGSAPDAVSSSAATPEGSAPLAGSATSSSSSPVVVATAGSGLVFHNTYSSSCTAQFETCIVAAEKQLESIFTSSLSLNMDFVEKDTSPTKTDPNPFALSNTPGATVNVSYANLKAALLRVAPHDVLPSSDPSGGAGFTISDSYARFLGLGTATPATDATVTLNTYYTWDFKQDVINGLTHEISENALGRVGGLGDQNSEWSVMDLFRYTASGNYDTTDGRDGLTTYFSSNGGATTSEAAGLSFYNEYDGSKYLTNGDPDDWNQNQVFGSTGQGETFTLNQTELDVMNTLGWKVANPQDIMETSGDWLKTTDWSGGYSPITVEDAFIGVLNAVAATIGANGYKTNITINSIGTNTISTLEIEDGSSLTATDGTALASNVSFTWASGNLGAINVDVGGTLTIGDKFDNEGSLTIGGIKSKNDLSNGGNLDLDGVVKLTGADGASGSGDVYLGRHSGTYGGYSYGDINGDGLVNVNNTIAGGGIISIKTLDNQASGKINSNQGNYWLEIMTSSTFTNEGQLNAADGSTLQLGGSGDTEAMTNTGAITIQATGDLAIAGNYTISGSGAIDFKGAGAKIVSNGNAATFDNESTINADISGQIGDSKLTFDNTGKVFASGAGVTLTIDTGGNEVNIESLGKLQAEDDAILTIASNLNNQYALAAGSSSSTGTVQLGRDGGTGSMSNAGVVEIFGQSDLAIRGDYTISGDGSVSFKGAGAEITSDGKAATLTNDSTIDAGFSGQIGDQGLLSSNNLTLDNEDIIDAVGTGVKLQINTGAIAINNENGGTLEATDGGILVLISKVANNGFIAAGSSSSAGTVELGQDGVANVMNDVGGIGIYAGSDLAIRGNYTIGGAGPIDFKGAGGAITSDGAGPATFINTSTINASFNTTTPIVVQIGDVDIEATNDLTFVNDGSVLASGANVTLKLKTGGNTIEDGGGLLEAGNGATLAIRSNVDTGSSGANGGTIEAAVGGTVSLTGTVADDLSGTSEQGEVNIAGGTFAMSAGASVSVPIVFTSGGTLQEDGVTTIVNVSGANGTVDLSGGSKVAVTGGPDAIAFVSGSGNVAKLYNTGAQTDAVTGSDGKVVLSDATLSLDGSDDLVNAGVGNTISLTGGTADTISVDFSDTLTDGGAATVLSIGVDIGAFVVHNFASDLTGVIDLLSGVGGYVNRAQALAAVTSDGHGGSLLSLASTNDGSIDLIGLAPTSLTKNNFKIG